MSEVPKEWSKCTVAEIKAELSSRGLKTVGNKVQLISLLKEDDEKKQQPAEETADIKQESVKSEASPVNTEELNGMEVDKESDIKPVINNQGLKIEGLTVDEPQLSKGHFTTFYLAVQALKTVMIKPFHSELVCPTLAKWMAEAREFKIRKDADGKSAAVFIMKSVEDGDAAFAEMKTEFGNLEVEVYHLSLNPKYEHAEDKTFDAIFKDSKEDIHFAQRQVILENLPESVTEQTLKEMFPEAYNVATYHHDPISRGIATLEYPSVAKAEEVIQQNSSLVIGENKVMVNKLSTRQNKWSKKRKAAARKFGELIPPEEYQELTDEERLTKCEEYFKYKAEMNAIQDREDIFGREKLEEHERIVAEWKKVSEIIKFDTDRRVKAKKVPLPEPEEMYTGHTKALIIGKPKDGADNVQKEDGKSQTANKAKIAEAKKRSSTTSNYKGSPPQKKQNFSGNSKFKARGGSSSAGRGGFSRSQFSQQNFNNRSAMGSGNRSSMGSAMSMGFRSAMGGGYGMGRMGNTAMGGGYGGMSNYNRGSSGYGDGGYGQGNTKSMESMIMNLTDKLSRLERMQMTNTSQSDGYSSGYGTGSSSNFDRGGFNRGNSAYGYSNAGRY